MSWTGIVEHWPSLVTASAGLGVGGLVKTLLDHRRTTRRSTDEVAMSLVGQLTRRIETMEANAAQERALCDANMAVLRHRMNNLSESFNILIMVVEMAPDRARDFAARLKERRVAQERAEAAEKAGVTAIALAAAKPREVGA